MHMFSVSLYGFLLPVIDRICLPSSRLFAETAIERGDTALFFLKWVILKYLWDAMRSCLINETGVLFTTWFQDSSCPLKCLRSFFIRLIKMKCSFSFINLDISLLTYMLLAKLLSSRFLRIALLASGNCFQKFSMIA